MEKYNDFEWVFSYEHLYESYQSCRCGVSWKGSVQKFITNAPLNVHILHENLMNSKYKSSGFYEFDISERGKMRHIKSVKFDERVVQKCLCDYSLTPMLSRTFIYDNGASTKGKGYTFAINRITKHLRDYIRRYGTDGYILLYDFEKFFDNIDHNQVKDIISKHYTDERLIALMYGFIDDFGVIGLGLGSQISQILALVSGDRLDHFVKEKLQIKGYGRYMDDGYLIHKDKEYLKYCLKEINRICEECGLRLNPKKTQIVKLSRGFTYLHCQFKICGNKVIRKLSRKSITRCRRRLKTLKKKLDEGKCDINYVKQSYQSWRAYASNFSSYKTVKAMDELYCELFGGNDVLQNK